MECEKMRKIKISDLSKENLDAEHCEDHAYVEYLCGDAGATGAFDFFGIEYNEKQQTLTIPDAFDFDVAIKIVNDYLEDVECDDPHTNPRAEAYDEWTADKRGADDGTFDYAGTFVISILCLLQTHLKGDK